MTLSNAFRITSDDLMGADTYHTTSLEPWDGYDVRYVLEKANWERQQHTGLE